MNPHDIDILEGNAETDEVTFYETLQRAINAGTTWRFQGSYGRTMMAAIEAGYCMLGTQSCEDAYGSPIPSRTDIKPGAKGSRDFVAQRHGEEWVRRMENVGAD